MNKDKATEALLLVRTVFASEPEFLQKTASTRALELIAGALAQEARAGKIPLSPAEWTAFLAHTLAHVADGGR
jgi:peptidoglycan/LPS O-acetylase OafA/YrhL